MLELKLELDLEKNKKYKVEAIMDSIICTKAIKDLLQGLYHLVYWNDYSKNMST